MTSDTDVPPRVLITGAAIVAEARSWLGTPWQHQAALKGVGCDCTGLVRGVISMFRALPAELLRVSYARTPDGVTLLRLCREHLLEVPVAAMEPGDVLALRYTDHPQHLGFVGDYVHGGATLIHALDQRGRVPGRVVEHRLDATWRARIVAVFRIAGDEVCA
jgi:NlpC/P60 family putative phage cell wall peptidase